MKARDFILTNARMIERRLFSHIFDQGPPEPVMHAVLAYQNTDGGFGFGMEPDTASPESQPLFTMMALRTLDDIRMFNIPAVTEAVAWLASVATPSCGLPWMLKPEHLYPGADHFDKVDELPAINPTAPILALLIKHQISHPWIPRAESFLWQAIPASQETQCADCILLRLLFLEQRHDTPDASREIERIKQRILSSNMVCNDLNHPMIGLYGHPTPLNYAPHPQSILRTLFSTDEINTHLDALIARQHDDGQWSTTYGISPGTALEWDGSIRSRPFAC
jgi:hypothetical protein